MFATRYSGYFLIICVKKKLTVLTPIISLVYSTSTLLEIEEPYLPAEKATNYELGACYNVTVECKVSQSPLAQIEINLLWCYFSALKLEKKCNFKSTKTHYLHFHKWQKINFCTGKKFKTTKNAILGLKKTEGLDSIY